MISYLAGFFDGEGCVTIGSNGSLQLRVINTPKPVLDLFKLYLGGEVLPRKQIVNKPQYHWSVYGDTAIYVATLLSKHCVEKKTQLLTLIQWADEREDYAILAGKKKGIKRDNPERDLKIKEYQEKLTKMKMEGI